MACRFLEFPFKAKNLKLFPRARQACLWRAFDFGLRPFRRVSIGVAGSARAAF